MDSLNKVVAEYTEQLSKGQIQRAYKGIMTFMADMKAALELKHPDYASGALYVGYMDMTYFAITPPVLKNKKLKIAVVYLHEHSRFEVWLAGNNRQTQAQIIEQLVKKDMGKYRLSQAGPGVDSIVKSILIDRPDFDKPDELIKRIACKTAAFIDDMISLLSEKTT